MKPTSIPMLVIIALVAAGGGALVSATIAARGGAVPVSGWFTGAALLVLAAVLLVMGLPLQRYLRESEERRTHPSLAPRKHQLDLPTAYRTVLLARAASLTGALVAGAFGGQALHLGTTGGGDLLTGLGPTLLAALGALVLGVVGVIVERWGMLPPEDGEDAGQERV